MHQNMKASADPRATSPSGYTKSGDSIRSGATACPALNRKYMPPAKTRFTVTKKALIAIHAMAERIRSVYPNLAR